MICCSCCNERMSEDYMVKNDVWKTAGAIGYVHLACLENLLGRPLQICDFTSVPVNNGIFFGFKLGRKHGN